MVRFVAVLLLIASSQPAFAADWSRAGGGLLIRQDAGAQADSPAPAPPAPRRAAQPFDDLIVSAAAVHGLDPKLLHALVVVESAYRPDALSSAGAAGLTQLMPSTAAELGVRDRYDIEQNLSGGARYLSEQLRRFGDVRLALAAYNAGPSRVSAQGRVPQIAETQNYVSAVVDCYLALSAGRAVRTASGCRSPAGAR